MIKKYEFTGETKQFNGVTLKRIVATRDFGNVKAGDVGGWIENEKNLSHEGNAWVRGNAQVWGNAWVRDNAEVWGDAEVYDNAHVWGNAQVRGDAKVCGDAEVRDNAKVCGDARVLSTSHVLVIGAIGSRNDFTTFYRDKDNEITVKCGCFCGKINDFLEKVQHTHGDNHHAKIYRMAAELAKASIDLDSEESKEIDR